MHRMIGCLVEFFIMFHYSDPILIESLNSLCMGTIEMFSAGQKCVQRVINMMKCQHILIRLDVCQIQLTDKDAFTFIKI